MVRVLGLAVEINKKSAKTHIYLIGIAWTRMMLNKAPMYIMSVVKKSPNRPNSVR